MKLPRKHGALDPIAADKRANLVRSMQAKGMTQTQIAKAIGINQSSLSKFIARRNSVRNRLSDTLGSKLNTNRPTVVKETSDSSTLDPEQTLRAIRLGIDPSRMAWLLACKSERKMVTRKKGVRRA